MVWNRNTAGLMENPVAGRVYSKAPVPIGPKGSKQGNRGGDGSKITPFKRYQALVWFDMFVLQPVPSILRDFLVDGDLAAAANRGMEESGWLPGGDVYDFELRNRLGIVFKFPMVCPLKIDHGVQTGSNALGYAEGNTVQGCNSCHSRESSFWKYLGLYLH